MMGGETVYRELDRLRPEFRVVVDRLLEGLRLEGLPFRVFESWRSAERQAWLYSLGRARPGRIVTHARVGGSYHEYGAAVDLVLWVNGEWTWDTSGKALDWWARMHRLAVAAGGELIPWDFPHVQMRGVSVDFLRARPFKVD